MANRTTKEYSEQDKIQQSDHDAIIRLEGKLDQLINDVKNLKEIDIKELKDGTSDKLSNLEVRVKRLEDVKTKLVGVYITVGVALTLFGIYIRGFIEDLYKHIYGK